MSTARDKKTLPFHMQFLAGAIAGVSETIIMYPLDVVKTRFQIQVSPRGVPNQYHSILDCFNKMIHTEGASSLYRGILAPILVEAPKRAVKFVANEYYSKIFLRISGKAKVDQTLSIFTGMSTGATEALVVVSFDLVKIRMQDKNNAGKYKNTIDCIVKIFREEGLLAFSRGLTVTVMRHAAWNGGYFGVIHKARQALPEASNSNGEMLRSLIAGTIGGTVGTALNTPFDVIKTRIQKQIFVESGQGQQARIVPTLIAIVRDEGWTALYKGFVPKVLRLGPGGGVLLVVFDAASKFLGKYS